MDYTSDMLCFDLKNPLIFFSKAVVKGTDRLSGYV